MKDDRCENAASPDPAKEVYWTPLMAVVWIVYRDMNEVRKVWSRFVKDRCDFNFEDNRKYVVGPNEAVRELWRRLESVELVATGIFQGLRRVKLARTFAAQVEALKRYRSGGEQTVTVQHVHVAEGGQAIVGNVTAPEPGGGANEKAKEQPHALAYAPGAEMPRQVEEERASVPRALRSGT